MIGRRECQENLFPGTDQKYFYKIGFDSLFILSTSSLISSSVQGDPTIFLRGFSPNKPLILRSNVLWQSCNIPHPPFSAGMRGGRGKRELDYILGPTFLGIIMSMSDLNFIGHMMASLSYFYLIFKLFRTHFQTY